MAEINEFGATGTTLQEYRDLIEAAYLAIDPDWDLDPASPDGQAIAIWAELFANLDEQTIYAFQSIDPNTAVGAQLRRIGDISGILWQEATGSTAEVTFTGTPGTLIEDGFQIRNSITETIWETQGDVFVDEYGFIDVGVVCLTLGPEPASIGSLSEIVTPIGGVVSVTNTSVASLGRNEESNDVFRVRRNLSVAKPGDNQVDSIRAELFNLEGVKKVKVIENYESAPDANGVEGHSICIFIDGGDNEDIAAAIANGKAPGCGLNANNIYDNKVQEVTQTSKGSEFTATFYRPELTNIFVVVTIFGSADPDTIKQAIVDYANADLFTISTAGGFDITGFDIGDIIAAGKLFTPVNKVVGDNGYAVSVRIGTDEYDVNYDTVVVGFNGLGVFDVNNIEVIQT